jgi:tetratricopeptide (TPR) repeat protein
MMLSTLLVCLAAAADSPRQIVLTPEGGAQLVLHATPAQGELPQALVDARKLAESLRYEEAVVEYQRYLAVGQRPARERAEALFELGFIHLVLGDEANADIRAASALELDPGLELPASAAARQIDFLNKARKDFITRARLRVEPRLEDDAPGMVRAKVADPQKRVKRVLLRHALAATGPFHSTVMQCADDACTGAIPPPQDTNSFTAWYYVEALDDGQLTLARASSPDAPLQLAVVGRKSWYQSPVVWGIGGAALVAVATVVYLLSPAPPR